MGGYAYCDPVRMIAANAGPLGGQWGGHDVNSPQLGKMRAWGALFARANG